MTLSSVGLPTLIPQPLSSRPANSSAIVFYPRDTRQWQQACGCHSRMLDILVFALKAWQAAHFLVFSAANFSTNFDQQELR